ncbi:MAG: HAD hydrolase family protein [Stomatobaculum sp.]|nr:HAD hydrolase family protein [Stomatobaculum sp.]
MNHKIHFFIPGQRIIRSVLAAWICMGIYYLRGKAGMPFFGVIAAMQCITPYAKNMRENGSKRIIGTVVGGLWGVLVLYLESLLLGQQQLEEMMHLFLVGACGGAVIYSAVLLNIPDSAYFSAVVFLSIVMNHVTDEAPSVYVLDRLLDTAIGVAVGIFMNSVHFPRLKRPDILFVSGIDQMLSGEEHNLSSYTKVELNRLVDDGMKFTVISKQTPALIRDFTEGVRLKYPVVAMDGAVMYDMNSKQYLYTEKLDDAVSEKLNAFLKEEGVHYFVNTIEDHLLVIFYRELVEGTMKDHYLKRRLSPYRNYVHTERDVTENVIYFVTVGKRAHIVEIAEKIRLQPWSDQLRLDFDGYDCAPDEWILRIYAAGATREKMLQRLKEYMDCSQVVKFGRHENGADVFLPFTGDRMVKEMKKRYAAVDLRGWKNILRV